MTPLIRRMSVVRTPGTEDRPMIRIANRFLSDAGFEIGGTVEVHYQNGVIIIKKLNEHESNNIQKADSVADEPVSDDAEQSIRRPGREAPGQERDI